MGKRQERQSDLQLLVSAEPLSVDLTGDLSRAARRELKAKRSRRGEREADSASGRRERWADKKRQPAGETGGGTLEDQPGAGIQGNLGTLSASGGGSYYIYSFDGMLLAEYDIGGNCVRDYIYLCGQLVAEYRPQGGQYYYYTSDQINSTRIVTNTSGTVVYSAAYDPYGGIQKTWTSTYTPTLKFSGKERDGESNLDYFGARYYDKAQYRFISVDPITARTAALFDPQLWHLYSYCRNSPVTFFDPEGKQPIFIRVVRDYYSSSSTVGVIYADGICFGATYELPYKDNIINESCIEPDTYKAWIARSDKKGYDVIWLEDKHGRKEVQIHPRGKELLGCITLSRKTFNELMNYIALRQASSIAASFLVDFYFPLMIFVLVENNTNPPAGAVYTDWFFGTLWDFLLLIPWYLI